jgi:hypothetical protein
MMFIVFTTIIFCNICIIAIAYCIHKTFILRSDATGSTVHHETSIVDIRRKRFLVNKQYSKNFLRWMIWAEIILFIFKRVHHNIET